MTPTRYVGKLIRAALAAPLGSTTLLRQGFGMARTAQDIGEDCQIAAQNLACVRGGRMLFAGVEFALSTGDALHITGPNGIGKSSLIGVLAGLLPKYAGDLAVSGAVALSDERLALDLHWPLAKSLEFWAKLDRAAAGAVAQSCAAMGLGDLMDVPVRMFSTGQRKRAGLARMLASGAQIWLLDEPVNGLDSASSALLGDAMAAHRAGGGIIIAASHQDLPIADIKTLNLEDYRA